MRIVSGFIVGLLTISLSIGLPLLFLMLIGYVVMWILGLPTDKAELPISVLYVLIGVATTLAIILIGYALYGITLFGNDILKKTSPLGEDDIRYDRKIPL